MPTTRYIETVFESLEMAVEFGVIEKWSIAGTEFVIHQGDEKTSVPSMEAADYLIDLFQHWDRVAEDVVRQESIEEVVRQESGDKAPNRSAPARRLPIERDLTGIELPKNSIHLVA